ncbi:MAG TPA: hypothetical protein VL984_08800 [Acidimicrobiales bacterium]|nr:hypothetical protein [Acidimicrobiales bacterium]
MTSRSRDNRRGRSEPDREDRPSFSGPRQPRRSLDEEVVALRDRGQSYSAVASALGLKRATDAQDAFLRAMRSLPPSDARALRGRELARLDQLEARIRSRDAAEPAKMERHLGALAALRETMG